MGQRRTQCGDDASPSSARRCRPTTSLLTAGGLLVGVLAAQACSEPRLVWACALAGAGLASRREFGAPILAVAVGLAAGWTSRVDDRPAGIEPDRPVVITARLTGTWERTLDGWRGASEVEVVRQDGRVVIWPARLQLYAARPLSGSRWRLRGYLRRSPGLANGVRAPPGRWRLAVASERLVEPLRDGRKSAAIRRLVRRSRGALADRIRAAAGGRPAASLVEALVLGRADALGESTLRGLRRAGLAHVTALSGLHLGVLAVWVALILRRAPANWRWLGVVVTCAIYLVLGGARPSLVRAGLMLLAVAATLVARRPRRALHALSWSAAGLALFQPAMVEDLSFQLTFAATLGVIVFGRLLRSGRGGGATRPLAASLGAQVTTLALTLPAFHWLPIGSIFWNLVLVPPLALAVPASLLWCTVAVVAPGLARSLVAPLDLLAALVAIPGELPASLMGGVPWGAGRWSAIALAGGCGLVLRWPRRAVLLPVALLLASGSAAPLAPGTTAVHFIDVGQGDATLLRDGPGGLLVDGGGWRTAGLARKALLPTLAGSGLTKLEVMVVTHGDSDHCRGLVELAGYIGVEELWLPPAVAATSCGRALLLTPRLQIRPLWAGMQVRWRSWTFSVLNPRPRQGSGVDTANETSLVLSGESRGRRLLLTGDIGHRTEFDLLQRTARGLIATDLLKVAHHGSSGSSSRSFLALASPSLAVISAGRGNRFGHPSPTVLTRLDELAVPRLQTDRSGRVAVSWSEGSPLRVRLPGSPP